MFRVDRAEIDDVRELRRIARLDKQPKPMPALPVGDQEAAAARGSGEASGLFGCLAQRNQPAADLGEVRAHGGCRAAEIAVGDGLDDAVVLGEAVVIFRRPGSLDAQPAPGHGAADGVEHVEHAEQQRAAARLGDLPVQQVVEVFVLAPGCRLPHLHEPQPGLAIALGYNGRGVAMASRMGKLLADDALGGEAEALGFPISPLHPIPGHAFRLPALAAVIAWRRFQDWRAGAM